MSAQPLSRKTGLILVIVSAVVFSSAGIFTKGVTAEAWTIIFWRGLAAAGFTFGYLALRGMSMAEIRSFGWPALAVTLMGAAGTAAFIPAFKLTTVANVALIYGAAPFLAAGFAWAFVAERPSIRVTIASLVGFGGVLIIVSGSIGGGALTGDLLALCMTVMLAGIMVIYRRYPDTTAALPAALSSVVLVPVAGVFGDPMLVGGSDMPWLIAFGLVFAVASVTLSEGARRLPAGETALLSTLEMPLAPILALLVLGEAAQGRTVLGGAIILAAVIWSQRAGRG